MDGDRGFGFWSRLPLISLLKALIFTGLIFFFFLSFKWEIPQKKQQKNTTETSACFIEWLGQER